MNKEFGTFITSCSDHNWTQRFQKTLAQMFNFEWIGRLHPLIVHLPIGILLFAFAMQVLQWWKKSDLNSAIGLALLLGSISAAVACVAGWVLAQSGEYDPDMVLKHQWTGIASAVLGGLAFGFKKYRAALLGLTVVVLSVAGHLGGSLTHGEDYLFPAKKDLVEIKFPEGPPLDFPLDPEQDVAAASPTSKDAEVKTVERRTFLYRDVAAPILEKKCYSCHGASKMKGGLRLDSEAAIQKGGKNGAILLAGNPEKSNLFSYLLLPEDDDLHMPPKGKPQLSEREIAALHFWIKKGAPFAEVVELVQVGGNAAAVDKIDIPPLVLPKMPSKDSALAKAPLAVQALPDLEAQILSQKVPGASTEALDVFKQKNVVISNFGNESNYLMANFVNVKNYEASLIEDLKAIAPQLLRVRLSKQPVQDQDLKSLSACKNITSLNLEQTQISNEGLKHLAAFPKLEQLNLYGTKVSDQGLGALAKCTQLKSIYLWQTQVTDAGIAKLQKALPHAKIERGGFLFPKPDTSKAK
jgi:uncharacterized membrane protein/mono/diheme cytochrome c family protein